MTELAPALDPIEIGIEDGVTFAELEGLERLLAICRDDGIVGLIEFVPSEADETVATVRVDYLQNGDSGHDVHRVVYSPELSDYAFERLGFESLAVELEAEFGDKGGLIGAKNRAHGKGLEKAGFRVAAWSHEKESIIYEKISNPPYYGPVKVDIG